MKKPKDQVTPKTRNTPRRGLAIMRGNMELSAAELIQSSEGRPSTQEQSIDALNSMIPCL